MADRLVGSWSCSPFSTVDNCRMTSELKQTTQIDILIASPGDLIDERERVLRIFTGWNNHNEGVTLHPVMWEHASTPGYGQHPQSLLNEQMIERCSLLVAMFWTKLGTPTPTAQSGTIQEIYEFIDRKGPGRVMIFFCQRPMSISPTSIDTRAIDELQEFQKSIQDECLYASFENTDQFETELNRALGVKVAELLDGKLPVPKREDDPVPPTEWCDTEYADPRLRQPIEFGSGFEGIVTGFVSRTRAFDRGKGASNDTFILLASHTFRSAAYAIEALGPQDVPLRHRQAVRDLVRQLKELADNHADNVWPFGSYWEKGSKLAEQLASIAEV